MNNSTYRQRRARERRIAREAALEETVAFHAKAIERIYRRFMPKGWNIIVSIRLGKQQDLERIWEQDSQRAREDGPSYAFRITIGPGRGIHSLEGATTSLFGEIVAVHDSLLAARHKSDSSDSAPEEPATAAPEAIIDRPVTPEAPIFDERP